VGLGNPGPEYSDTRHNVGFWVTGELADRHKVKFRQSARWQARTARIAGESEDVLLAEPTTFMNLSGRAVRQLMTFYKLDIADLLVLVDDAYLTLEARLGRWRRRGPQPRFSDSAVITLALIIETFFPGNEELGLSFVRQYHADLFPHLLPNGQFNYRRRLLSRITELIRRYLVREQNCMFPWTI